MRSHALNMDSKLVLLIEDNIDDERLTLRALQRTNVMNEVVVACDGEEAIDFLFASGRYEGRNINELPTVIILDLKLPKLSGLEVLRRIRTDERTKHIPVVVLTASEDSRQIEEAYATGANSFVFKPTSPTEYGEMVLQIAMYWLLLNRTSPARALA
jgi:CheY-like chemotaxis protein